MPLCYWWSQYESQYYPRKRKQGHQLSRGRGYCTSSSPLWNLTHGLYRKATEIAPLPSLRGWVLEETPTLAQRMWPFSPGRSSARCSIPSKHKNINKTKTTPSDKATLNSSVPPTTKRWPWWQIGSHMQPLYTCCLEQGVAGPPECDQWWHGGYLIYDLLDVFLIQMVLIITN